MDGAIHRAGGPEILQACQEIRSRRGGCPTGEAVITTAGKLPARYVVHTVGPVWQGGASDEMELLGNCYTHSLALAEEVKANSVAFPNISTGIYGYPKEKAARIALQAVKNASLQWVEEVTFVCFDAENFAIYRKLLDS